MKNLVTMVASSMFLVSLSAFANPPNVPGVWKGTYTASPTGGGITKGTCQAKGTEATLTQDITEDYGSFC